MIDPTDLERLDGTASLEKDQRCYGSASAHPGGIDPAGGEGRAMRFITSLAAAVALVPLLGAMPIAESDAVNATAVVQHELKVADLDAGMAYEKPYVVVFWGPSLVNDLTQFKAR